MKRFWWGVVCLVAAVSVYGVFLVSKRPADVRNEPVAMEISAEDLVREFSENEVSANEKFIDKVLIVKGSVTEVKADQSDVSIALSGTNPMSGVTCSLYSEEGNRISGIKPGDIIRIKGKCTGMLTDVILNNCSIVVN